MTAAAQARAAIVAWLLAEHDSPDLAEVAELLISELVSNSVRHAGLRADQPVRLSAELRAATLRVEVSDAGTSGTVASQPAQPGPGGLGLELVARLARAWGVERDDDGTTVWVEIDATSPLG
jgi:anti-sigma regulatory factor (Ser/Thr protein kinase)